MQYTASQTSMLPSGGSLKEVYIPLWVYSSGSVSNAGGAQAPIKGSTTVGALSTTSGAATHALNSSWPATTKFALEVSMYVTSGGSANAQLYDLTASAYVASSASLVSTTATTMTVVRSNQFTLTPGHTYCIALYPSVSTTYTAYLSKAYLIAFLS